MTLDDLSKIYEDASTKRYVEWVNAPEDDNISSAILRRAGIRAVVAALRDEVDRIWTWEDMPCNTVLDVFNEILGSDAVEPTVGQRLIKAAHEAAAIARGEAAGGPTREDGRKDNGLTAPDRPKPAADFCEWTKDTHPDDGSHYETACGDAWCSVMGGTPKQDNYSFCPSCGKPIIFKEPTP